MRIEDIKDLEKKLADYVPVEKPLPTGFVDLSNQTPLRGNVGYQTEQEVLMKEWESQVQDFLRKKQGKSRGYYNNSR